MNNYVVDNQSYVIWVSEKITVSKFFMTDKYKGECT